jgi:hypothetical protein
MAEREFVASVGECGFRIQGLVGSLKKRDGLKELKLNIW